MGVVIASVNDFSDSTLIDLRLADNQPKVGPPTVSAGCSMSISNCTIAANLGVHAAGIFQSRGKASIDIFDTKLLSNVASGGGGAGWFEGEVSVKRTQVFDNSAQLMEVGWRSLVVGLLT